MTNHDQSRDQLDRLTVAQAAVRLGITEAGVRKRVQRKQIRHERDERRRLWVWVSADEASPAGSRDRDDQSRDSGREGESDALTSQLRAENEHLKAIIATRDQEIARRDTIIMNLSEAMKALRLPPPSDTAETSPQTAEQERPRVEDPGPSPTQQTDTQRPPWWRRIFGG